MSAEIVNPFGTEHVTDRAESYHIDDAGNLHLTTPYGGQVATFAAGHWARVRLIPTRDSSGRFVKRGQR